MDINKVLEKLKRKYPNESLLDDLEANVLGPDMEDEEMYDDMMGDEVAEAEGDEAAELGILDEEDEDFELDEEDEEEAPLPASLKAKKKLRPFQK